MKLHANNYSVEKSGDFEENQFTIEASAKAFMILSDGLYSNKILAVVRELSTNAYDSHVDAGCKDKPFEVHLPTRLEPFFHVRDFGTSMTHDQCMKLYTTYFRSTRNDSNDSVGCLGLGSKAPFAYSDSFTVEAFLNGEKRIYSAYRNESGNPTFSLMETVATDEPNGIKVSMSVRESDMPTFQNEAYNVYKYFNVRPKITGAKLDKYSNKPALIRGKDGSWEFHNDHENFVIMGQVAYRFDSYDVSSMYKDGDKIAQFLYNCRGLRLFVSIGDVDITPSRESLSFSKQTKENLYKLLTNVVNDIKASIEDEIKQQPTLFLARKKYVEIEGYCYAIKSAVESLNNALEWNGKKLFDTMLGCKIKVNDKNISYLYKSGYRRKIESSNDVDCILMGRDTTFFIDDCTRGGTGRLRQEIKDHDNRSHIYIYKLQDGETVDNCSFLTMLGDATINDVRLTSSLPKIVRQSTYSGSDKDNTQVEYYDQYENAVKFATFSVKSEDAVYIPMKKGMAIFNGYQEVSMTEVVTLLRACYNHRHFDKTFYFVSPSTAKSRGLDNRDNWEGPEYFLDMLKELAEASREQMIAVRHTHSIGFERYHKAILMTETDNNAKTIVQSYHNYKGTIEKNSSMLDCIYRTCRTIGIKIDIDIENFDPKNEFYHPLDNEMKKYALIYNHLVSGYGDHANKMIANYIDLVENSQVLTTV